MYYLGLDMGTNSVGWAVTDENYNILRAKGKDLWGIREFEEAKTSVERRTHRISRRRRQREVVRQGILKAFFADEIEKVDPHFYVRLENSKYFPEDKEDFLKSKNGIFDDENYQDKDYYREYPTIFHLRKELINSTDVHDVRLVYLAIANMFKHRGHFLDAGLSDQTNELPKLGVVYGRLVEAIDNIVEQVQISLPSLVDYEVIVQILSDKKFSKTRKTEQLMEILNCDKKEKATVEMLKAICGRKVSAKVMFSIEESEDKIDIDFSDSSYEDKCEEIHQQIGDECYDIIEILKEIYDIGILNTILGNGEFSYLSEARVESYEAHKRDLELLKSVMRKYSTEAQYNEMFRSDKEGTYSAYVKSYNHNKKDRRIAATDKRKKESLYKTIRVYLKNADTEDKDIITILEKMDNNTFLPKQLTSDNGVIPNQLHKRELRKILQNAETYLEFLKNVDETGFSVSEKILQLFSFHLPYYVGPTSEESEKNNGNGWVVRKEKGQVLPWNMKQLIDMEKTQERFIMRMVRNCTYIANEKVLPKESLLYQRYCVLNEINNIKINDEKISVELKQEIYCEIFKKGKRVTRKRLCDYLKKRGLIKEDAQVSGIDIHVNNALTSYGKFHSIFGENMEKDSYQKMAEDIIYQSTLFGDEKKLLRKILRHHQYV